MLFSTCFAHTVHISMQRQAQCALQRTQNFTLDTFMRTQQDSKTIDFLFHCNIIDARFNYPSERTARVCRKPDLCANSAVFAAQCSVGVNMPGVHINQYLSFINPG
jgi:hypothetical protein